MLTSHAATNAWMPNRIINPQSNVTTRGGGDDESPSGIPDCKAEGCEQGPAGCDSDDGAQPVRPLAERIVDAHEQHPKDDAEQVLVLVKRGKHHDRHRQHHCQLALTQLGQRMQTTAKQGSHLLRGHRVAGGKSVDAIQAGTHPHPGHLTPLGVVGRQPDVTFLGRIQRRDLSGQIVVPRPSCELVDAHRHTHPKGVHTVAAVRPTRAASGGASGVSDMTLRRGCGGTSCETGSSQ
jgi:hypothetical protein